MIQLVLRNLISNAIKFTTEGGKITVSMDASENDFDIRVSDTGVGMSFEDQEKLFNSTNHFTTRGTNNEKGTGLGLLLCKEFVEKNDGTIEVSSIKGEGTTFSVKLKKVSGKKEEITV
jgi:signal transduction histidine kinase